MFAAENLRSSVAVVPTSDIIFLFQQGGGDRSAEKEIRKIRLATFDAFVHMNNF